jgi:Na+/H+ antiporter NhaD/arsenite permease-like protein
MIGLLSAVVDNVPMVAGAIDMYPLEQYPMLGEDAAFWHFLAYCAGTGGSILIIGSAAGVAVMGIEKVEFFWYLKRISGLALAGYFSGIGVFLLMQQQGWLI